MLPLLYGTYPLLAPGELIDFFIELDAPSRLRRVLRPQVSFSLDGHVPFKPLPRDQFFAMFEWGLNWCVANSAHQYLNVHSAVVARGDRAVILPGAPGSGKSTLCAGLLSRGWRLLSDEMALVSIEDGLLTPVPRPVSLKERSIDIVEQLPGDLFVGPRIAGTAKGTLAHLRAPQGSIAAADRRASAVAVVFPRYRDGASLDMTPMTRGATFLTLAENSFNYHVLGDAAFDVLAGLVDGVACHRIEYGSLDDACAALEALVGD